MCGSADPEVIARQSFEALAGSLIDGYDIACCRMCGFGYASDLPTQAEFDRYYAGMSRYEDGVASYSTSPEDQARCRSIVDMVQSAGLDKGSAVLDVGCATGSLLAVFKDRGFRDVEGLDPSPTCAAIALQEHEIRVLTGSASDVPDLSKRYGLVTLSEVLEHLLDPIQVLRDIRQVLESTGLIMVEVPDVEGFSSCAKAPFQEFSMEHVNFFSSASIASAMARAGFERVAAERLRIPWQSGGTAAILRVIYRPAATTTSTDPDVATREALLDYVSTCEAIEASVRARILTLADRGGPVIVWGVGTHTRHLLKSGAFDPLMIAAWVDSDPKYQGTEMRGAPVLAPSQVAARNEPILISSGTVHHEIARQLRHDLGLRNEVVFLYE